MIVHQNCWFYVILMEILIYFRQFFAEKDSLNINQCIFQLRQGLDRVGLHRLAKKFPIMLQFLRPSASEKLSRLRLLQHLKPVFSQEESNSLKFEKECYVAFVRYCSECAAGRRMVTLENILEFTKCASLEPICGYYISPLIQFTEVLKEVCFKLFCK